ncbi:MAG TPA: hypothetical protein VI078_08925 [bacterium]
MTPRSTDSSGRPRRVLLLAATLLLTLAPWAAAADSSAPAAGGASPAASPPVGKGTVLAGPPPDTAVLATVDGVPITVGQVRDIMRVTGAGPAGAGGALERALEGQLLYAEAVRRGLREAPEVVAAVESDVRQLLEEQYVLWKYPDEVRAKNPGSFHQGSSMSGSHGGVMSEAALLGDMVENLEKKAGAEANVKPLPDAYQKPNTTGAPRGALVVARFGENDVVLWSEVEAVDRMVAELDPPLEGVTALRFARSISRAAGRKLVLREAEAALPAFREKYDRGRERLARAAATRRLIALEVEPRLKLGEAELRAYYEANLGRYGSVASPPPFDQVRGKVARDARLDAVAKERSVYAAKLRGAATIAIDRGLLESLGE